MLSSNSAVASALLAAISLSVDGDLGFFCEDNAVATALLASIGLVVLGDGDGGSSEGDSGEGVHC